VGNDNGTQEYELNGYKGAESYTFFWAPTGSRLVKINAPLAAAKQEFRRMYRNSYARFMGEVYQEAAVNCFGDFILNRDELDRALGYST
jgi:hypothetical protein